MALGDWLAANGLDIRPGILAVIAAATPSQSQGQGLSQQPHQATPQGALSPRDSEAMAGDTGPGTPAAITQPLKIHVGDLHTGTASQLTTHVGW